MYRSLLIAVLSLSATMAQASTRYLVKVKSPSAFNSIVAQMRHASPAFFQTPRVAQFQLFNQSTKTTEALENLGMLVVESDDVSQLKNNPNIEYVEKEVIHPLIDNPDRGHKPRPEDPTEPSNPTAPDDNTIPMPWGIAAVKAPQAWSVTRGENVKVLVLDTGIDKDHPALQGQLLKGQNFTTDGGSSDFSDTVGHGTHVSGTILAKGDAGGLVGVAPKAKLLMGKVCSEEGCSSVAIVQGVNWGISEGVQVMSLSLGGAYSTPSEEEAFRNAEKANIVVVAASGNDSAATVSFPAALPNVFAVGAVDSNSQRASFSNYGPELSIVAPGVNVVSSVPRGAGRAARASMDLGSGLNSITALAFAGSPVGSIDGSDVVDCKLGQPDDFKNVSVSGKVALIQRGTIAFKDKAANAIAAGARGVLIYNNVDDMSGQFTVAPEGGTIAVPAVMISKRDGEALQARLTRGPGASVSMGVIATDYDSYQGTSMATPHVAGVVALVRSANPNLTAAQVRSLLKDTATALGPNDKNEYGAGLINADAAVRRASVTPGAPVQLANGF